MDCGRRPEGRREIQQEGSYKMEQTNIKSQQDWLVSWLEDAIAMENALAAVLKHRISDAKDFPEIAEMDRVHLSETLEHANRLKQAVSRFDTKPSTAKSLFGSMFGMMQAPMTGMYKDEIVKNCLMDYAAEQFEVASYTALIAAATEIEDTETANLCRQNLQEDQAMAERIMAGLPKVVSAQLGAPQPMPGDLARGGELFGQPQSDQSATAGGD